MSDYRQILRECTLKAVRRKPVKTRADALNLIEAVIVGNMTPNQIVDAVLNDKLPIVYKPARRKTTQID